MRYALLGAMLMVAGIAARIEAGRHHPTTAFVGGACIEPCSNSHFVHRGLSPTSYDLVRIGGWALLIFGAVIVAFALVREFRPHRGE